MTVKTLVRYSRDNGKEWGYKNKYIMIDIFLPDTGIRLYGWAEAKNKADIPNARKRALYRFHKEVG